MTGEKIGKVYFKPGDLPLPNEVRSLGKLPNPVSPAQATPLHSFLLIRSPFQKGLVPIALCNAGADWCYWNLSVIDFAHLNEGETYDIEPAQSFDPAPLWMRLLLAAAERSFKPLVSAGHLGSEMVTSWTTTPNLYDQLIDKRSVQQLHKTTRENLFIIVAWDRWKKKEMTFAERLDHMKRRCIGESLTVRNLEKRAERLGLF